LNSIKPKIEAEKKAIEENYRRRSQVLINNLKQKSVDSSRVISLKGLSNILRTTGLDTKAAILDDILSTAAEIVNNDNVKKAQSVLSQDAYKVRDVASKVLEALNELSRYFKKVRNPRELNETSRIKLEELLNLLSGEQIEVLKQIEKDLKDINIEKIKEDLSSIAKKLAEKARGIDTLRSTESIFGFSNANIINMIEKMIRDLYSSIRELNSIDIDYLQKKLSKIDRTVELLNKALGEKTASIEEDFEGDYEEGDYEDEFEDEIEDELLSQEDWLREVLAARRLTKTKKPTTKKKEKEKEEKKKKKERVEKKTRLPRSAKSHIILNELSYLYKALTDIPRLANTLYKIISYASNLMDAIKLLNKTYIYPIYHLIAKDLGIRPNDIKSYKELASKIEEYLSREQALPSETKAEEVVTKPEEKVETPKPVEQKAPEVSKKVVEEKVVKPEKAVEPEKKKPVEVEEEKPVEVKKEEPVEVEEEPVEVEEEPVEVEEVQPEVEKEEELGEVSEEVVEETIEEAEEPEEGTAEVVSEKEQEADVSEVSEAIKSLGKSVSGPSVKELRNLEKESDRSIVERVKKALLEKASKGEIKVVNELKLLYPVLYLVYGESLAEFVTKYYGSFVKDFATFNLKVDNVEELKNVLDPKNLSQVEKQAISEIKRRIYQDQELSEILRNKESWEKNADKIVSKILDIIRRPIRKCY
jgi:hypothetical protein